MTQRVSRRSLRRLLLILLSVVLLTTGAAVTVGVNQTGAKPVSSSKTSEQRPAAGNVSGSQYHTDHATFLAVNDLAGQSSNVVRGTVESSTPGESTSLGTDPSTGAALPTLPHTDFLIRVDKTLKGAVASGANITVTLAGGVTDVGPVTVDGVPVLPLGTQFLFFLASAPDGKYYPLAGGSAIATQSASGVYVLSDEVTGSSSITFGESQVIANPNTIHVVVTTHPVINLNGSVQSGGIVRIADATKSSLKGDALVDGSVISTDISIVGDAVTGSFSIDGAEFKILKGKSVGGVGKGVTHVVASVSQVGISGNPTTNANLDITTN